MSHRKPAALASLTATYVDSSDDGGSESDDGGHDAIINHPNEDPIINPSIQQLMVESQLRSQSNSPFSTSIDALGRREHNTSSDFEIDDELNAADFNMDNEDFNDEDIPSSPISFHQSLRGIKKEDIVIPPEPKGSCSQSLLNKVNKLHEKMLMGHDMDAMIQKRKDFRNPSIYEKLIAFCGIDELATNYPPDIYDPHKWRPESYYEELSKRQTVEMDKRTKEKTKVDVISGTKKSGSSSSESDQKRTKWDSASSATTIGSLMKTIINPAIPVTIASGTKPTVISAVGSIKKK